MNGYGISNYDVTPKGWDWTDILVRIDPPHRPHTPYSTSSDTHITARALH